MAERETMSVDPKFIIKQHGKERWRGPIKRSDAVMRFESKFSAEPNGCWEWHGVIASHGYGEFTVGGARCGIRDTAHRWAWLFYRGAAPAGCDIHHRCENRRCVNPWHLIALRRKDHAALHPLGAATGALQRAKTHCVNGHPYDEANTYVGPTGHRACRICQRASMRRTYWQRKEQQHG